MIIIVEGSKGSGKTSLIKELMKPGKYLLAKNYKKISMPGNYAIKGLKNPGSSLALDYQDSFMRSLDSSCSRLLCDRGIVSIGTDGIYGYFANEETIRFSSYLRMNDIYYSKFLDAYRKKYGSETLVVRLYAEKDILARRIASRRPDLMRSEDFFLRNIDFLVKMERDAFDLAKSQMPGTAFIELNSGARAAEELVKKISDYGID